MDVLALDRTNAPGHVSGAFYSEPSYEVMELAARAERSSPSYLGDDAMDKDRFVGSAKNVVGKAEGALGDAAGDAETQASGRAREAAGTAQNLYGQVKDVARDATDTATAYAQKAMGGEGTEAVAKMVQDNPVQSLLIAGGIGFVVALLLRRPVRRPQRRWRYDD